MHTHFFLSCVTIIVGFTTFPNVFIDLYGCSLTNCDLNSLTPGTADGALACYSSISVARVRGFSLYLLRKRFVQASNFILRMLRYVVKFAENKEAEWSTAIIYGVRVQDKKKEEKKAPPSPLKLDK